MQLAEYPEKIADLQLRLHKNDQQIRLLQDTLNQLNGEIESAIAFDKTLTNDAQRKAKRTELSADNAYQTALMRVQAAQDEKVRLQIELDLLKNHFSVIKLEMRWAIVQQETAIAA
jgi:SMC interacting uncharacterized protein involved in chromosome segregation